jgi:deoxyribodipyrimidine photolyase-related protein
MVTVASRSAGAFSFDAENRRRVARRALAPTPPTFETDAVTARSSISSAPSGWPRTPATLNPAATTATKADAELTCGVGVACAACRHFGPYRGRDVDPFERPLPHTDLAAAQPASVSRARWWRTSRPWATADPAGRARRASSGRCSAGASSCATSTRPPTGFRVLAGAKHRRRRRLRRRRLFAVAPAARGSAAQEAGGACSRRASGGEPRATGLLGTAVGAEMPRPVVRDVWRDGYSHHITRLMVLSNLGDASRRLAARAHRLVLGGVRRRLRLGRRAQRARHGHLRPATLMTTKPYVAGAAYIDKMSDYCRGCASIRRRPARCRRSTGRTSVATPRRFRASRGCASRWRPRRSAHRSSEARTPACSSTSPGPSREARSSRPARAFRRARVAGERRGARNCLALTAARSQSCARGG